MPNGSKQAIPANSIVTPLAQQAAQEKRIEFVQITPEGSSGAVGQVQSQIRDRSAPYRTQGSENRVVAIGADHGGFELKEMIERWLGDSNYSVIDCSAHSKESVDYPDYAFAVAQHVAGGRAFRGVLVDGAGIGSCMAANKVPGIRAAMCYDQATAVNSREHNNANVLTLGAGLIGPALAQQIVLTWLKTDFGGGRHARRVDKIDAIGRRFSK
jgi:ribose 5-phosphate isomerase B